ncbi:MAG: hypothetical protein RL701_395 [Pseudomonadota bacterium]
MKTPAVVLPLLLLTWASVLAEQPPELRRLPLVVHIARRAPDAAEYVADMTFVHERVERANQIFAPYHVAFVLQACLPLPAAHARLETRADRAALAQYRQRQVIDWYVVESLRDVDEPERMRRGVHWHAPPPDTAHYVITSLLGAPDVFAHELGHYLGNPEHSPTPGNLMSYERAAGPPFLDATQLHRLERSVRGYLARGELRSLTAKQAQRECCNTASTRCGS